MSSGPVEFLYVFYPPRRTPPEVTSGSQYPSLAISCYRSDPEEVTVSLAILALIPLGGLAGKGPEGAFPVGLEGTGSGRSFPASTPGSEP